jgi:hypothetical protein
MNPGLLGAAALALLLGAGPLAAQSQAPARQRPPREPTRADSLAPAIEYMREVFSYQGGTRDPFQTLVTSSDVRPTIEDLRIATIAYDPRGGNSVVVIREAGNPRVHRLRRGDQIGRLRVVQIRQYEVVFQVEEFGFERQEVLSLPRLEAQR